MKGQKTNKFLRYINYTKLCKYEVEEFDILAEQSVIKEDEGTPQVLEVRVNPGETNSTEIIGDVNDNTRLHRLLGALLSSEMTKQEKKTIIEKEYGIPMTESIERRVNVMCNLSEAIEKRGIERGEAKQLIGSVISLKKKLNISDEEACELLGVSY